MTEQALNSVKTLHELQVKRDRREYIDLFESFLAERPDAAFGDTPRAPLNHLFADGIYIRQIFLPAGTVASGGIHRKCHPSFLLTGRVSVYTVDDGGLIIDAPKVFIAPAGCKRLVYAHRDTIWCTVHTNPDELRDPDELRKMCVVDSYDDLDISDKRKLLWLS